MRVVVLGATGAMGRIIVQDLFKTSKHEIVVASRDIKKAEALAGKYKSERVKHAQSDVRDVEKLANLLHGAQVVINAVQYDHNLTVMKAALKAGTHYLDLGGLFHMTRKQMKLHEDFKKANLTAVLGMGSAPGITNVLASFAADKMKKVKSIEILLGDRYQAKIMKDSPLSSSYSVQTIFEEFTLKPAVFSRGFFHFIEPMTVGKTENFPKPVGKRKPIYTLHSEVATLPLTYKQKGIREVSFRIAFDDDFVRKVRLLKDLGLTSLEEINVNGHMIKPRDLLVNLVNRLPKPVIKGTPKYYEVIRVVVKGDKKIVMDCHVTPIPEWGIVDGIDTGSPPSIVAQMLLNDEIIERGVIAPETCVPHLPFFKALKKRKMKVRMNGRLLV